MSSESDGFLSHLRFHIGSCQQSRSPPTMKAAAVSSFIYISMFLYVAVYCAPLKKCMDYITLNNRIANSSILQYFK